MISTPHNCLFRTCALLVAAGACAPAFATPTASPIAGRSMINSAAPEAVALTDKFADPGVTVIRFRFTSGPGFTQAPVPTPGPLPDIGTVDVALFNARRPLSTTNFLNYVDRPATAANSIQNTVIHRSAWTQFPGAPAASPFVVQGGGFRQPLADNTLPAQITTDPPISNEFNAAEVPLLSNVRGTIAMARTAALNSATSQYYFNMDDRNGPGVLDNPTSPYAVFGRVLGNGMPVLDAIAQYDTYNFGGAFGETPLNNVYAWQTQVLRHNWTNVLSITRQPSVNPLTFSAASSNTQILGASANGTSVTLAPVAGKAGSVLVTITATSPDLTTTTSSFYVRVNSACSPADVASLGGALNPDNHITVDDIVAYLSAFFSSNLTVADVASLGGAMVPDGQLSADDIVAFLSAFFAANCQ